ncbi:MAG: hypothetical protein Ta2B_15460 [Termitinemataceae bacterium]|nr:MAG: hypothetical protein Ta2B_15460 [Termitinemataceae bacterium]
MSRYNTEIDINNENNSQTEILRMLKPNSSVLEFGPAGGYMTRYMREELNCTVFIIELDKESFDSASEFADGGFCGNIEDYLWTEPLKGRTFDYIIFADVLEHLTKPENALENAMKFLKYDGRVLLSVPNIAHSSIIIGLMQNNFDYHSVGLLDETHLKHFTYNTLKKMLEDVGLFSIAERAIYLFPFSTEFGNHYRNLIGTAQKTLAEKKFGTVYQFIFECAKTNYVEESRDKLAVECFIKDLRFSETLKIYAEYGGILDEHNTREEPLYFGGNDIMFDLSQLNATIVRLNFGDSPATVTLHKININDNVQDLSSLRGNYNVRIGNTFVFNQGNPFIYISADRRIEKLNVNLLYDVIAFEDLFKNIAAEHDLLATKLNTILSSRSWRFTKPLRQFTTSIRQNKILYLFAKGLLLIKRNGLTETFRKVISYTIRLMKSERDVLITEQKNVQRCFKENYRSIDPFSYYKIDNNIRRINLVTTGISKEFLFGGVATSLIIATEIAVQLNLPLRIITRFIDVDPNDYYKFIELFNLKTPSAVTFYSDYDRNTFGEKEKKIDISPSDIFIATSWWTAHSIRSISLVSRFFYIIQEVEHFFYPHGDTHLLCTQMMSDPYIDFIVNSNYLFDYFKKNNPNIYTNGVSFEPAFPLFVRSENMAHNKKYKLFFYARPCNPRNLFFYGCNILDICIERGIIDFTEWDIYFAGENIEKLSFCKPVNCINMGNLGWQRYKNFLSYIDLALCLMYTPHPSYPPFDVAASGGVVITNKYLNKIDFPYSENIIMSDLDTEAFSENMKKAVALSKNKEQRIINYNNSRIPRSWKKTLVPVINFVREKIDVEYE